MKKIIWGIFTLLLINLTISAAELKAKEIAVEAAKKENATASVEYIKSVLPKITVNSEKRAAYILLGTIQEQMADYPSACSSYAAAAGIAGGDAEGMPKKSNEQLVLDAVRCALSSGDFQTADSYLNSSVRNSKNERIQSYIKLYTQWSALCKANTTDDLQEPIILLQAYLKVASMKEVQPAILLTLWYVTGDNSYSVQLSEKFPKSVEASIVKGDVQLLPSPFWFFVPKSGEVEMGSGSYSSGVTEIETPAPAKAETKTASATSEKKESKVTKLQLGLFKTESNAKLLVEELKKKGFTCYITPETRASGTTYYIVTTNENEKGSVADELRSAGYDCYVIE